MGKVVGIDLGTTNTVVAIADGPQPRVLDNAEGRPQTRSVVGLHRRKGRAGQPDAEEILVGDVATDNFPMAPRDTIISIKRLMGRGMVDQEVRQVREEYLYEVVAPSDGTKDSIRVLMGGKQHSPVDISAMILRKVKSDAEFRLGEEVTDAVITVPAYFNQAQKRATRQAGWQAGLRVLHILDEPTAAAIAFGMDATDNNQPQYLLVYDLGGGTFDISVLLWSAGTFAQQDLEGNMWLGGDNFDQRLVDHVVEWVKRELRIDPRTNLRFMATLKKAAQQAKERLSTARTADIIIPALLQDASGNPVDVDVPVTLAEFEGMVKDLVEDTVSLTRKALQEARLTPEEVSYVLMAGNATCMPMVQRAMEEFFGREKVLRRVHPKHCVALGAAKLAAVIRDKVICDCGHVNRLEDSTCGKCQATLRPMGEEIVLGTNSPMSYGIQAAGDEYHIFIRKNEPCPTENPPQTFYTRLPNQRMIIVPVYGGERMDRASANEKQGDAFAILPPGLPKGTAVRLTIRLDGQGIFYDLTARLENGQDLKPWIVTGEADAKAIETLQRVEQELEQRASSLSPEELDEVERARNQAFEEMRRHNFQGALSQAQEFAGVVGRGDPLRSKAENLIGYTEMVIQRYEWMLEANKVFQLEQLIKRTREALQGADRAVLEQSVEELDRATDDLPDALRLLLGLQNVIFGRIQPRDPALAATLRGQLEEAESALRSHSPSGPQKLTQVAAKVSVALDQLGAEPARRAQAVTCSNSRCGRQLKASEFVCPACGTPRDLLGSGPGKSSDSFRR